MQSNPARKEGNISHILWFQTGRTLLCGCTLLVFLGCSNSNNSNNGSHLAALSPAVPDDVTPAGETLSQDDLDNYSWQLFIAMNWPATESGAVPETMGELPENPRVWETYIDGTTIMERDASVALRVNEPFHLQRQLNTDFFLQTGSDLPSIDRNQNFTVNEMAINPTMVDFIVSNGLTTTAGLENYSQSYAEVLFPTGVIEIKAGWFIVPSNFDAQTVSRYYTTTADVSVSAAHSATGNAFIIESVTVALIALHINQKTPSRPQWTWSTFEHVDLYDGDTPIFVPGVEGADASNRTPLDVATNQMPEQYLWQDPDLGEPTAGLYHPPLIARSPNEVPYPDSINRLWQQRVPAPWSFYQLVTTQWVDDNGKPQPENTSGVSVSSNAAFENYLIGDQTISLQVPGVDVTDSCPQPGDGSTLWAEIEQISNYQEYPEGVIYTDTWSSCLMCHQLGLYKYGENDDDVIGTDYSFIFKSIMPAIPCTSSLGSPL